MTDRRTLSRLRRDSYRLPGARTHGLRSTYNDGCRCDACRDAEADYSLERARLRRQRTELGETA